MQDVSIYSFDKWSDITDYESDENTVTLLNKNDDKVITFSYSKFTREDFNFFKSQKP